VSGEITLDTGAPVTEFSVRLEDAHRPGEVFHSPTGRFRMSGVPPGSYSLRVAALEGIASRSIEVLSEETTHVRLQVSGTGTVVGEVRDLDSGLPMPGVVVGAYPIRGGMAPRDETGSLPTTDERGRFAVNVPAGALRLTFLPGSRAETRGYPHLTMVARVPANETVDVGTVQMARLRMNEGDEPGTYGFTVSPAKEGQALEEAPLSVATIDPAGPAASAGLSVGDVIVSVDGVDMRGKRSLFHILLMAPAGEKITLGLEQGRTLPLIAAPRPKP
jgi:S1-C subfamily serine protease